MATVLYLERGLEIHRDETEPLQWSPRDFPVLPRLLGFLHDLCSLCTFHEGARTVCLSTCNSFPLLLSTAVINFVCTEEQLKSRDRKWSCPLQSIAKAFEAESRFNRDEYKSPIRNMSSEEARQKNYTRGLCI